MIRDEPPSVAYLRDLMAAFPRGLEVTAPDLVGTYRVWSWTLDGELIVRRDMRLDMYGELIVRPDLVAVPAHLCERAA